MNTHQNYVGRGNYSSSRLSVCFWRRKSKQAGKAVLYCRIHINNQKAEISTTGITIWRDYWDGKRVSEKDPESTFKNEQMEGMRHQLMAIYNDLFRKGEKITAAKIKRIYREEFANHTLLSGFTLYLEDSAKDPERKLNPDTLVVYENVRKNIQKFLENSNALDLKIEEFDLDWLNRFRRWMKKVPLETGKIGYADSYVAKHSQTIKFMLDWTVLHKLADINPLKGHRVKNAKFGDPIFLTDEEFERLKAHRFEHKGLQQTADVFIILCRSGFHYGDLRDLAAQYKKAVRKGIDGNIWLMKDRIKTQVKTRVPEFDEVREIVAKYGGWEKLPLISLVKFNAWLKVIAAKLDLPETLSSKAGRKTFTDWCFNVKMLSTQSVMVMLGRKSDSGLEVYGRPDERRVAAELAKSKDFNKRPDPTIIITHPPINPPLHP